MLDYSICYKQSWNPNVTWPTARWGLFLSAFNSSDRVKVSFQKAQADERHWFISPEYNYVQSELPTDAPTFIADGNTEAEHITSYFQKSGVDVEQTKICIDITGFMRSHLLVLLKYLSLKKVKKFDVIYSEPTQYTDRENTRFSDGVVVEVRQISGFEGNHIPDTSNDVLIIGAGYDDALIAQVAESKENARKLQLLGLPSLRADMYQENVLRAQRASEQLGSSGNQELDTYFAPANDPFITANALSEIVTFERQRKPLTNLYLCPLATKVQTLGFGLYFLSELKSSGASIIFPFCESYARETSIGVSRTWLYQVEFLAP